MDDWSRECWEAEVKTHDVSPGFGFCLLAPEFRVTVIVSCIVDNGHDTSNSPGCFEECIFEDRYDLLDGL